MTPAAEMEQTKKLGPDEMKTWKRKMDEYTIEKLVEMQKNETRKRPDQK